MILPTEKAARLFLKAALPSFFLVFFLQSAIVAQNVTYIEEPAVADMMDRHVWLNKQKKFVEGWRVQILATTDRLEMERERQNFRFANPEVTVDWVHEKPWYKLRAGAFISKLEALHLLNKLKQSYPGAYTTKDTSIEPKELLE
jgi:hypothetical protein